MVSSKDFGTSNEATTAVMNYSNSYQIITPHNENYDGNMTFNDSLDYSDVHILSDVVGIWITGLYLYFKSKH